MKALYAGTFDPFTIGHQSIVDRALAIFPDGIIIALGHNMQKVDSPDLQQRLQTIRNLYAHEPRVEVITYSGLTTDAALAHGAGVLLRGVRSVKDYEYERQLADINRAISGLDTLLLLSEPTLSHISSSMVRELRHYGKDVSPYLPKPTPTKPAP